MCHAVYGTRLACRIRSQFPRTARLGAFARLDLARTDGPA
jgi:hypothetical protein